MHSPVDPSDSQRTGFRIAFANIGLGPIVVLTMGFLALGFLAGDSALAQERVTPKKPTSQPKSKSDGSTPAGDPAPSGQPSSGQVIGPEPEPPVGLVADVNGAPITFYQLNRELNKILRRENVPAEAHSEMKQKHAVSVLEDMIVHRLIMQQCDILKIQATEDEVERFIRNRIEELRREGNDIQGVEEFFRKYLQDTGDSEEEVRTQVRELIRRQKLLRAKVWRQEYITPQELRTYYLTHKDKFATDAVHQVRFLFLDRDPSLHSILEKVRSDLDNKVPFSTVVDTYSPPTDRGDKAVRKISDADLEHYNDTMREVILSLEIGQVSPMLDLGTAIVFVMVEERTSGKSLPFATAEAQEKIRKVISDQRRDRQLRRFQNELMKNAQVTRFSLETFKR